MNRNVSAEQFKWGDRVTLRTPRVREKRRQR